MSAPTSSPPSAPPPGVDAAARRQQRLLLAAWIATLLPLAAFGYLTWQSWTLARQVQAQRQSVAMATRDVAGLEAKKQDLERQIAVLDAAVQAQKVNTKHYRDVAGIRIQFYRQSDRAVVDKALQTLGFKVDTTLGASRLINAKPNTIGFGSDVADLDLRGIAVALIDAGFPLKRIAPAVKQTDPRLIQIYASVATDNDCGLLTVEQVRAGANCGPRPR
ncbi:MAG: hypothetical protein ABI652_07105 [Acidobacteriota bacterium]